MNNSDSEWKRILSNPDNFLMSESLRSRDLALFQSEESDTKLVTSNAEYTANLVSLTNNSETGTLRYTLQCNLSVAEASKILLENRFKKIILTTSEDKKEFNVSKSQKWSVSKSEKELILEISWQKL